MIRCVCIVQTSQTPDVQQASLCGFLDRFSQQSFGLPAEITWIRVPEGKGYTAMAPSTSSVVAMTANEPLTQEKRKSLLVEFCDLWRAETGCSMDEIVAVISDPQLI